MDPEEFRRRRSPGRRLARRLLRAPERFPVLAQVQPGDLVRALPSRAPEAPESFDAIFDDFTRLVVPGITHWNHPGFFAYFAISGSGPGVLAEMLAAGLNVQAMLWRTSPAATELEEVALGWLRDLMQLPPAFEGVIYDTASMAVLHALAAAREAGRSPTSARRGLLGRPDLPRVRVYLSAHTHSSADKSVILLGLGKDAIAHIPGDAQHAMRVDLLREAIAADRRAGIVPLAVIATIGTTSSTAIDPVNDIADLCEAEGIWLHVDAAYAGVMAMLPAWRTAFRGAERADTLVVNPHKWLFTPFDCSVLYCRRMDVLAAGVLAGRRVPEDHRDRAGEEPDGHRHSARPALPRAEAVDGAALLRRGGHPPAPRGARGPGADVCRAGSTRRRGLGAYGAGALQRRLLPPSSGRHRRRGRPRTAQRRDHGAR